MAPRSRRKMNFAICYDLVKIRNKGRCIFSQTGESRKTKSDGGELKVSFGHNNGLALVY